jgi:hypothetical protein
MTSAVLRVGARRGEPSGADVLHCADLPGQPLQLQNRQRRGDGRRVGYTAEGDKVEWLPADDGSDAEWPMILRRSDKAIHTAYQEFWDKVWWNRHQILRQGMESTGKPLTDQEREILETANVAAGAQNMTACRQIAGHRRDPWITRRISMSSPTIRYTTKYGVRGTTRS